MSRVTRAMIKSLKYFGSIELHENVFPLNWQVFPLQWKFYNIAHVCSWNCKAPRCGWWHALIVDLEKNLYKKFLFHHHQHHQHHHYDKFYLGISLYLRCYIWSIGDVDDVPGDVGGVGGADCDSGDDKFTGMK